MESRICFQFAEKVEEHFSFLKSLGFECVSTEATLVRFESPRANINVYHGRRSFEIGLELEIACEDSNSFSFFEVYRLFDQEQAEQYRNYATRTTIGVAEGVRRLGQLFRKCVDEGLFDDDKVVLQLTKQRDHLRERYALETELLQTRRKAEKAWKEKDFVKLVEVLTPYYSHLTQVEKKKVKYAKSNL